MIYKKRVNVNSKLAEICSAFEGYEPITENKAFVMHNGLWGIINDTGEWIKFPIFEHIKMNSLNFPLPAKSCDTKLWGYISEDGHWIISPIYTEASAFSEGLARVKLQDRYGYIDIYGNLVIKPKYNSASDFFDGIAQVSLNHKQLYINTHGLEFNTKEKAEQFLQFTKHINHSNTSLDILKPEQNKMKGYEYKYQ